MQKKETLLDYFPLKNMIKKYAIDKKMKKKRSRKLSMKIFCSFYLRIFKAYHLHARIMKINQNMAKL